LDKKIPCNDGLVELRKNSDAGGETMKLWKTSSRATHRQGSIIWHFAHPGPNPSSLPFETRARPFIYVCFIFIKKADSQTLSRGAANRCVQNEKTLFAHCNRPNNFRLAREWAWFCGVE
jgi:hypothetical protein